jgi:FtsH-binding integral membrane protein
MADTTTDSVSKLPEQVDITGSKVEHGNTPLNDEPNELPQQFSLFSTLAFGFSMTNSWLGYSATFITPLLLGGSPTVFFGLIAASIASCFISRRAISVCGREHPLTTIFV